MTPRRALVLVLAVLLAGCTGTRVREFMRESYRAPASPEVVSRSYAATGEGVWRALRETLDTRDARIENAEPEAGVLEARLTWSSPAELEASVDLGSLRRVLTRTERTYRSWSPLDYDCNACVVEKGNVVDQRTELVEEHVVVLAPTAYRVDARLVAGVVPEPAGARLDLRLVLAAEPPDPPGLRAGSTGHLETALLEEVAAQLRSPRPELR